VFSTEVCPKPNKLRIVGERTIVNATKRYTAVINKSTVYNTVTFNKAVFFDTGLARIPTPSYKPSVSWSSSLWLT